MIDPDSFNRAYGKQVRNRYTNAAGLTLREQDRVDSIIKKLGNMSVKNNLDVRIAGLLSISESILNEALEIAKGQRQHSEYLVGFLDENYLIDP